MSNTNTPRARTFSHSFTLFMCGFVLHQAMTWWLVPPSHRLSGWYTLFTLAFWFFLLGWDYARPFDGARRRARRARAAAELRDRCCAEVMYKAYVTGIPHTGRVEADGSFTIKPIPHQYRD